MSAQTDISKWWWPSLAGFYVGAMCCAATFWPSLVPRPWVFQGVLSGVIFALGYGVGIFLIWLWHYLELPVIERKRRLWMYAGLICTSAPLIGYALWNASYWQDKTRALMGMPAVEQMYYVWIIGIGTTTAVVFILLATGVIAGVKLAAHVPLRYVQRRIASLLGAVAFLTLLVVVTNDTLIKRTVNMIDTAQAAIDITDPPGATPPLETTRSGSPDSLIKWDRLGRAGKRFVHEGPRRADIETFTGRPAKDPVRAYVGLRYDDDTTQQADLALLELQRTGAFSRKLLVIATPTGTGWVQNGAIAPLEYLHDGDVATVSVQYSYLPSPQSLILQPGLAQDSAAIVFDTIYRYWKTLPAETRPRLYLFGLSLGSLGSETSVPLYAFVTDRFHGALWAGPTFRNPMWKRVQLNRNTDSPAWQPQFENGELVRVFGPGSTGRTQSEEWSPIRAVFLVNPSDPIVFFEENMWSREPEWMRPPRGPDVADSFKWLPVISFFQVAVDMLSSANIPAGHGHNYAVRDYVEAWAAVTARDDWTAQDTKRLMPLIANEPW